MTSPLVRVGLSSLAGLGMALGSLTAQAAAGTSLVVDGNVANTCPDGGTAITRGCRYSGTKTFDNITLQNGAVIDVTPFDNSAANKATLGNLVLKSLGNITIDATSRITARGRGYQAVECDDGPGPSATAGGKGGCSVYDSGGGGAHFGKGGKGTKDCFIYPGPNGGDFTCTFPQEWEEDCSSKFTGAACPGGTGNCCLDDGDQVSGTAGLQCYGATASNTDVFGDELPSVAGMSYWHNILDPEFGAAGGDKGCRDGYDATNRAGNGGGRIVLWAGNAGKTVTINGRITTDGRRGCAQGNDSAGGGAGGTILIIGDTVTVGQTARISARGGRGGDSQPKALACTQNSDCGSGQLCRTFTEPASGNQYKRCDPANCTPSRATNTAANPYCDPGYVRRQLGGDLGWVCIPTATDPLQWNACTDNTNCDQQIATECTSSAGCLCLDLGGTDATAGVGKRCVPNNQQICDYLDYGENEEECRGSQNNGVCDDCAGGGGGGIINVQSRVNNIDPRSIFDVRGGNGGICPICAGEAGAGAGELQIDAAYVGEICDGKDNDFNGLDDDGLGKITCPDGSMIDACTAGKPGNCPTVAACNGPVTDTRPRFAVVVDTSGSMLLDNDGEPRFGDGSVDFPGVNGTETRLYNAKGALTDVLAAFPESDYALARYYQDTGLNRSCQTANWFECAQSCCSYDDPADNITPAYPYYYPDGQCVPSKLYGAGASVDDSLASLNTNINIGWSTPTADCINYSGSCGPPKRGAQYLVDFSQPLSSYLSWLDNKETSFKSGATCPGGDCELRATGPTPLGSSLEATKDFLAPRIACDNAVPCRKYNVILLTDGAESCQGDPEAAAKALNDGILKNINGVPTLISVKTYVIGFSTLPAETVQLNNIAAKGGTGSAYFVTSRAQLANAMATIISGSFVFEKCNGKDDDCDGQIDEDFPETQPPSGPGLACDDGQLGACKGTGHFICKADGSGSFCNIDKPGGASGTEVCNGIDDNCNGYVDESTAQNPLNCQACVPQPEICDGLDNDCDTQVDEVADLVDDDEPCGSDVGQCDPGVTVCVNGDLQCQGAKGPFTEACDGIDNDCDNVIDGMSMFCYVPAGSVNTDPNGYMFGECRAGTAKCTAVVNSGNASWGACVGQKLPTAEVCDGKDNDCNGVIDDVGSGPTAVGQPCCDPKVKLPALCGTGQCNQGKYACVGAQVTCVDAGKPSEEACDSIDNDCNDAIDDIKTLGDACTTLGGCPGTLTCDLTSKAPLCVPDGATKLEVCNGVDDDCDGSIDEEDDVNKNDTRINEVCDPVQAPNDHAPCMSGHKVCRQGQIDCVGAVHPLKEVCDLKDNDCDGVSDTLAACPGGNACIEGQCNEPCHGGEFPCPSGFDCKSYDGKKWCVPQDCDDEKCPEGAHCRNNKCTLDDTGDGGDGNTPGNSEGGETSQAGAPPSEGGQGNGRGGEGNGNEPSAGEPSTNGGKSGTSGSTGAGAEGNEGGSSKGAFGLVTGGGGCACRTTPARGGHAALAASLLLLGALFSRRRRAGEGRAA